MKCNKQVCREVPSMVRDVTFPDLDVFLKIFVSELLLLPTFIAKYYTVESESELLQSLTNSPNLGECCPSFWSQGHKQINSRIDSNFKRAALHILPLSLSIKRLS